MREGEAGGMRRGFLLADRGGNKKKPVPSNHKNTRCTIPAPSPSASSGMKAGFLLSSEKSRNDKTSKSVAEDPTSSSNKAKNETTTFPQSSTKSYLAKGFLLSKKSRRVEKPKTDTKNEMKTSQDLLSLEDNLNTSHTSCTTKSFSQSLMLADQDEKTERKFSNSLIIACDEDADEDDKQMKRHQTYPSSRPLISVVSDETPITGIQVETTRPHLGEDNENIGLDNMQGSVAESKSQPFLDTDEPLFREIATSSRRSGSAAHTERRKDVHISVDSPATDESGGTCLDFQRNLLRQNWDTEDIDAMVQKWSSTEVAWAWRWLLARRCISSQNELLIHRLFQYHFHSIQIWLAPETHEDRRKTLLMVQWLREFLSEPKGWKNMLNFGNGATIPNELLTLADQPRRTILAQEAVNVCLLLLSFFCEESSVLNLPLKLHNALDRLLKTLQAWKQQKKNQTPKVRAQLHLIQDWMESNAEYEKDISTWRREVNGIEIGNVLDWGGVLDSVCTSKDTRRDKFDLEGEVLYSKLYGSETSCVEQRILLRGFLVRAPELKPVEQSHPVQLKLINGLKQIKEIRNLHITLYIIEMLEPTTDDNPQAASCLTKELVANFPYEEISADVFDGLMETFCSFVAERLARMPENYGVEITKQLIVTFASDVRLLRILILLLAMNCSSELNGLIWNFFSDGMSNSSEIQRFLSVPRNTAIFLNGMGIDATNQLVTRVLKALHEFSQVNKEPVDVPGSAIALVLAEILKYLALVGNVKCFSKQVVSFLTSENGAPEWYQSKSFLELAQQWRKLLLEQHGIPDSSFAECVVVFSDAVIQAPSNVERLGLFGSIVGEVFPRNYYYSHNHIGFRLCITVETLILQCSKVIEHAQVKSGASVFDRLAPLLILRRLPTAYFDLACKAALGTPKSGTMHLLLQELAQKLARLISVHDAKENLPDERRIAAEVAGRSLSYVDHERSLCQDSPLFEFICFPLFSEFISQAKKGCPDVAFSKAVIRAKSAVYAACNTFPARTRDGWRPAGSEYIKMASFAIFTLGIQDEAQPESWQEVSKLQTGCMEFLALCLLRCLDNHQKTDQDFYHDSASKENTSDVFETVASAIAHVLRPGSQEHVDDWMCAAESIYMPGSVEERPNRIDKQTKTCLWNALILVATRCNQENGAFDSFCQTNLSWIAELGASVLLDNSDEHPLHIAAAMQVVSIILTRSKSFQHAIAVNISGTQGPRLFLDLCHWAITVASKTESKSQNQTMLALAALKLMLAILTVDSIECEKKATPSLVGAEMVGASMVMIKALTNTELHGEVKMFSEQILNALQPVC